MQNLSRFTATGTVRGNVRDGVVYDKPYVEFDLETSIYLSGIGLQVVCLPVRDFVKNKGGVAFLKNGAVVSVDGVLVGDSITGYYVHTTSVQFICRENEDVTDGSKDSSMAKIVPDDLLDLVNASVLEKLREYKVIKDDSQVQPAFALPDFV